MAGVNEPQRDPDVYRKFLANDLLNNNNAWWSIKFWEAEQVIKIEFARVGIACARPQLFSGSRKELEKRIRERIRPGKDRTYKEVKLNEVVIGKLKAEDIEPVTMNRIQRIFEHANEQIKASLIGRVDELSQEQIKEAGEQLRVIADLARYAVGDQGILREVTPWAQKYYNTIPTNLGHKIDPLLVTKNLIARLDDERERLDQLKAALTSEKILKEGGSIFDQLGASFVRVENQSETWKQIASKIKANNFELYEIDIPESRKRFESEQRGASKIDLKIHGTQQGFVRHILRSSLIVPDIDSKNRLFGYGIYFADDPEKSLGYTGRVAEKYLFLAEVKVGRQYETTSSNSWRYKDLPPDFDSLFAKAKVNISGVHNKMLNYNEHVIYNASQHRIKYLAVIA